MNKLERNAQLRLLWKRCSRPAATESDWRQLYEFVRDELSACNAPELNGIPDDRAACIDEYFNQKVFLAMRPDLRGPDHCGALVVFFRRYLRDRLDGLKRLVPPPEEASEGGALEETRGANEFVDLDQVLREGCGKSVEQIARSAEEFLSVLKADKEWAWLMLRHNYFSDADARVPLIHLAARHHIPSYHYRAAQLGINHSLEQGVEHFRGTIIGRWLEDVLGRQISVADIDCIEAALQILGFQALAG